MLLSPKQNPEAIAKIFKHILDSFFMTEKINDLIFKELIKRGYSLRGNTRVWNIADSKLWYLTPKQAKAYLDLENSKEYSKRMFETEIEMLKKNMPEITTKILHGSAINIIDIGCGDGKKAVVPLEVLYDKTKLRYCPIDISSYMVSQAIQKIKKMNKGEVVEFKWNISDFDNLENVASLLKDHEYRQNFLLFLGSTISNFEIHEVLYEIVEAMNDDEDHLLIGVALTEANPEELVKSYKASGLNDRFLGLILLQLGFTRDEIEADARYENSRLEWFYTVKREKELQFENKKVQFHKGDQILVAVSYRYSEEELRKVLNIYFDDFKFYFNKEKTWALVLCKK
jgi:uncharacterized SAM-dependent methyltransferase